MIEIIIEYMTQYVPLYGMERWVMYILIGALIVCFMIVGWVEDPSDY